MYTNERDTTNRKQLDQQGSDLYNRRAELDALSKSLVARREELDATRKQLVEQKNALAQEGIRKFDYLLLSRSS